MIVLINSIDNLLSIKRWCFPLYLIIKKIVALVLCLFIPMKKCAFFSSFEGMYNDNPKPVSELLHKRKPELPIYWVFSSKCREEMPQSVHKGQLRPNSSR